MFFFIGGIQQKTVDLNDGTKRCPSCGLYQARSIRIDHYVSVFFIPLFRIKTGEPFTVCERCGTISDENNIATLKKPFSGFTSTCQNCGQALSEDFLFCPFCGRQI